MLVPFLQDGAVRFSFGGGIFCLMRVAFGGTVTTGTAPEGGAGEPKEISPPAPFSLVIAYAPGGWVVIHSHKIVSPPNFPQADSGIRCIQRHETGSVLRHVRK